MVPRSRRLSFCGCLLLIVVFALLFFHPFSEPEFRLEDDNHSSLDDESNSDTKWPKRQPILGKHKFRPDGLLEVNMEGAHPIFELISRAEKEWEEKLRRASTTFPEVVQEYKRRYKRAPPKGFDLW